MEISLSKLKENPGKYFAPGGSPVTVTKNGKVIGHVVPAQTEKVAAAKALIGLLPKGIDLEKEREERLNADRR